jgi:hypothetical protein
MTRFALKERALKGRVLISAAALAALAAACAGAPPPSKTGAAPFGDAIQRPRVDALLLVDLDQNRDGVITPAEATGAAPGAFARADANKDGVLGAIELRRWGEQEGGSVEAAPLMAAVDRNGDGAVSPEEFTRYLAERIAGLDEDKDGQVNRTELFEEIAAPSGPKRPQILKGP